MIDIILFSSMMLVSNIVCYFVGRKKRFPKNEVDRLLDEIEKNMSLTEYIDEHKIRVGKDIVLEAGRYAWDSGWIKPKLRYQGKELKQLKRRQGRRIAKLVRAKIAVAAREHMFNHLLEENDVD